MPPPATLPVPSTDSGVAGLTALVDDPRHALLAFDFDGVLAPIVDDPTQARPHPRAMPALARLAPHVGWIAVITGRPARVAVDYGGFADIPELADLVVFGHYGRERWDARSGQVVAPPPSAGVNSARATISALLCELGAVDALVEDKGSALAVHTRRSADPQGTLERLGDPLAAFAAEHGLVVEPGRLVLELRPPGVDKGTTLCTYAAECAAGSVAYTGDDLGDLSAFAAIEAMRERGVAGVKIGSGSPEVVEIAERADLVVDGPAGVADLLEALATTLSAARHADEGGYRPRHGRR